jgi:hypothetical protein
MNPGRAGAASARRRKEASYDMGSIYAADVGTHNLRKYVKIK